MTRSPSFGSWLLLAALAWTAWPASARAGEDMESKAAAQVLFEEARTLVEHGRFSEACPKFAESQRLDPGIGTQLWLADCYENNGQTASAWASFKEAAAVAALGHDKRESVARARAAALETKLPHLTILVADEATSQGLEVRRDGVIVTPTAWDLALPVDPGVHTVEASAPGRRPWSITVTVAARADALQVTIPALERVSPPAAPPSTAPPPALAPPPAAPARVDILEPAPSSHEAAGNTQRIAGAGVAVAGVVGLGVGTFFSLNAKSTYDASNQGGHCSPSNRCDATGKQDRDQANQKALVATVAMGIGAAAAVGGGVLYVFAPKAENASVAVKAEARGASIRLSLNW